MGEKGEAEIEEENLCEGEAEEREDKEELVEPEFVEPTEEEDQPEAVIEEETEVEKEQEQEPSPIGGESPEERVEEVKEGSVGEEKKEEFQQEEEKEFEEDEKEEPVQEAEEVKEDSVGEEKKEEFQQEEEKEDAHLKESQQAFGEILKALFPPQARPSLIPHSHLEEISPPKKHQHQQQQQVQVQQPSHQTLPREVVQAVQAAAEAEAEADAEAEKEEEIEEPVAETGRKEVLEDPPPLRSSSSLVDLQATPGQLPSQSIVDTPGLLSEDGASPSLLNMNSSSVLVPMGAQVPELVSENAALLSPEEAEIYNSEGVAPPLQPQPVTSSAAVIEPDLTTFTRGDATVAAENWNLS